MLVVESVPQISAFNHAAPPLKDFGESERSPTVSHSFFVSFIKHCGVICMLTDGRSC